MFKKNLIICTTLTLLIGSAIAAPKNGSVQEKSTPKTAPKAIPVVIERTFAIIKPDAVAAKNAGQIIDLIEKNKFEIIKMKKIQLTKKQAEKFYGVHKDKPFYKELVEYMISGPVVLLALEKANAIKEWRDLMGATNSENAAPGTMRRMFGTSITKNATHGSDSKENAQIELNFFFPELQYI